MSLASKCVAMQDLIRQCIHGWTRKQLISRPFHLILEQLLEYKPDFRI